MSNSLLTFAVLPTPVDPAATRSSIFPSPPPLQPYTYDRCCLKNDTVPLMLSNKVPNVKGQEREERMSASIIWGKNT